MKKRLLALLVCAMMAASVFAGCNGGSSGLIDPDASPSASTEAPTFEEGEAPYDLTPGAMPIVTDPDAMPKFRVVIAKDPQQLVDNEDLVQTQRLEADTGLRFEWEPIPTVGLVEKINLMLTSSDLPDAFWDCIKNDMISQYMGQNILIPTEELTDLYMPNLAEIYENYPEYKALATAPDGHRYGFPYIEQMYGLVLTPGPMVINTAWLEQVGMEMPTTMDEWFDVLVAFRDAGDLNGNGVDDEIPYSVGLFSNDMYDSFNSFNRMVAAFGAPTTAGEDRADDYMTIIDGKVEFTAANEAFRDTAKFYHNMYTEDLIDVNSFSPGANPRYPLYYDQVMGDDAIIGCFSMWSPENTLINADVRAQYEPLPRLEGPGGKMGEVLNFSEMQYAARFAITSSCQYPEVLARFVDYMYTPEISISSNGSPDGYVYEKDASGKMVHMLDADGNVILPEPYASIGEVRNSTRGAKGPTAIFNEYYEDLVEYDLAAVNLLEYQRVNGKDEYLAEITPVPPMLKSAEEMAIIAQVQPQIMNVVSSYRLQWILEGNADETWDAYLAELDAAGLPQLMEVIQGAYDRFLADQA